MPQTGQCVKKLVWMLTAENGGGKPRPTGSFLAVIYVIMIKNTPTRRLFSQKKRRNRVTAQSPLTV